MLICSSFSRENGHPFLICSSLSAAQLKKKSVDSRPYQGKPTLFISPDHKAGYFLANYVRGGWLTSHESTPREFNELMPKRMGRMENVSPASNIGVFMLNFRGGNFLGFGL